MLMNPEESKAIGWEQGIIEEYPTMAEFITVTTDPPNRQKLIVWHRFLREPRNVNERMMLDKMVAVLKATCPNPAADGLGSLMKEMR